MKLSYNQRDDLLRRLPELKLSYENIHKKVSSDMYWLIPKGRKHLAWFTYFEDKRVCIFIELAIGTQKSIKDMYIVPQFFEKKLVLGTIFYGTLFTVNERKFFSIESLHYYKGKNVETHDEQYKLGLLKNVFDTELKQSILTNKGIGFGLPIIETSFETALMCAKQVPYEVYSIQNRDFLGRTNLFNSTLYKTSFVDESENKIFAVKPELQNDVYHLFVRNKNKTGHDSLEFFDVAAIPDYKTSVMMNRLFRNIKENENLDALEESDDDNEFENINEDKFVNLDKCVNMECVYNKKFDRYVPLKVASNQGVVVSRHILDAAKPISGTSYTKHNSAYTNNDGYGHTRKNNQIRTPYVNQKQYNPKL